MKYLKGGVLLLAAAGAFSATAANAQSSGGRTAASTWNDSWSPPDASQQAINLAIAEDMLRSRQGGFGPSTSTTNVAGDVNSYTTNNGPTSSSTAYNSVQSNSTTATMKGSGLSLTISSGQTITGNVDQDANAKVGIGSVTTTASSSQQGGRK